MFEDAIHVIFSIMQIDMRFKIFANTGSVSYSVFRDGYILVSSPLVGYCLTLFSEA